MNKLRECEAFAGTDSWGGAACRTGAIGHLVNQREDGLVQRVSGLLEHSLARTNSEAPRIVRVSRTHRDWLGKPDTKGFFGTGWDTELARTERISY